MMNDDQTFDGGANPSRFGNEYPVKDAYTGASGPLPQPIGQRPIQNPGDGSKVS
jgi:hypothetical protein